MTMNPVLIPVDNNTIDWILNSLTSITQQRFEEHYQITELLGVRFNWPLDILKSLQDKYGRYHIVVKDTALNVKTYLQNFNPTYGEMRGELFSLSTARFWYGQQHFVVYFSWTIHPQPRVNPQA